MNRFDCTCFFFFFFVFFYFNSHFLVSVSLDFFITSRKGILSFIIYFTSKSAVALWYRPVYSMKNEKHH